MADPVLVSQQHDRSLMRIDENGENIIRSPTFTSWSGFTSHHFRLVILSVRASSPCHRQKNIYSLTFLPPVVFSFLYLLLRNNQIDDLLPPVTPACSCPVYMNDHVRRMFSDVLLGMWVKMRSLFKSSTKCWINNLIWMIMIISNTVKCLWWRKNHSIINFSKTLTEPFQQISQFTGRQKRFQHTFW